MNVELRLRWAVWSMCLPKAEVYGVVCVPFSNAVCKQRMLECLVVSFFYFFKRTGRRATDYIKKY
jgi:hypothetical protein